MSHHKRRSPDDNQVNSAYDALQDAIGPLKRLRLEEVGGYLLADAVATREQDAAG